MKGLKPTPDDGFDTWCEIVIDEFSEDFFYPYESWIMEHDGKCDDWLIALFVKGKSPEQSAKIIERAFRLYKQWNMQ